MTRLKDFIGTVTGVAMIVCFSALIVWLVLSLASEQMPALKTIGTEIRCLAGFPEDDSACVRRKIAALNDQRRELTKERSDLIAAFADQRQELETEHQRLIDEFEDQRRAMEQERNDLISARSFVFRQGKNIRDRVNLIVGTLYEDAAAQTGLIRSFCYIILDEGGLDPRVGLAVKHSDGQIEALSTTAGDLALLEMRAHEVDQARESCPFPPVS